MKVEFVAASDAARELLGARKLLINLGMAMATPMPIMVDNKAAIKHLEGEASPAKAMHIDIWIEFVCDQARREIIIPGYVPSDKLEAAVLTKALFLKLADMRSLVGLP